MSEWDNTPLPTDRDQLQKWYENKLRALGHECAVLLDQEKDCTKPLMSALDIVEKMLLAELPVEERAFFVDQLDEFIVDVGAALGPGICIYENDELYDRVAKIKGMLDMREELE